MGRELLIRSCQGGGCILSIINAFYSNLNTGNLNLKIKVVTCLVSLMLTLTWGTDTLLKKLKPETEERI